MLKKYIEKMYKVSNVLKTYENVEVIFVDNDSADDSLEIAEVLQEEFPNLQIDTAPNLYPFSWEEPVEKSFVDDHRRLFHSLRFRRLYFGRLRLEFYG